MRCILLQTFTFIHRFRKCTLFRAQRSFGGQKMSKIQINTFIQIVTKNKLSKAVGLILSMNLLSMARNQLVKC